MEGGGLSRLCLTRGGWGRTASTEEPRRAREEQQQHERILSGRGKVCGGGGGLPRRVPPPAAARQFPCPHGRRPPPTAAAPPGAAPRGAASPWRASPAFSTELFRPAPPTRPTSASVRAPARLRTKAAPGPGLSPVSKLPGREGAPEVRGPPGVRNPPSSCSLSSGSQNCRFRFQLNTQ